MRDENSHLSPEEQILVEKHREFYESLDRGTRLPSSPEQERFVRACRGEAEPTTIHELAWTKARGSRSASDTEGETEPQDTRICRICNEPISAARLAYKPDAFTCVNCLDEGAAIAPDEEKPNLVTCPRCGAPLVVRKTHAAPPRHFFGCSSFPECRYTLNF